MFRRILISTCLAAMAWIVPVQAQDNGSFNFNMGGGIGVPLNPTAHFAGVGGNFVTGAGYNLSKHNAIVGQFMWFGLPTSVGAREQLNGIGASSNAYSITANYKYSNGFGPTFGYYLIGGGGWYYRNTSISQTIPLPPTPVVCQPIWDWYGFSCTGGFQSFTRSVGAGTSSLGGNGGIGFTLRVKDTGWKFYIESRYHYAASRSISTQMQPVTFGFSYH
jgi:hypothetical protein